MPVAPESPRVLTNLSQTLIFSARGAWPTRRRRSLRHSSSRCV